VRDERIDKVLEIFEEKQLNLTVPTSIQIPLSFNEGQIVFYSESDLENTTNLINEFLNKFASDSSTRIFNWEENDTLFFGTIKVIDGIPEMHYIEIQIGK
jgi:hypothetical protein